MRHLPLIYYPTTLYWVDDDSLFLGAAIDRFQGQYSIKASQSPIEAIKFFSQYLPCIDFLSFFRSCDEYEDYDLAGHLPVDFDFERVIQVQKNPNKKNDIAVIIVDYYMPEMSGIELCRKLRSNPAKKILLTGSAGLQEAVNAFNEGIIDSFIRKDDPNLDFLISENVLRLENEYFFDRTLPILNHLESNHKIPESDPIFHDFFRNFCKENDIIEYCLSEKNGGLLLLNSSNNQMNLVIHTDRTLESFIDLYQEVDEAVFFIENIKNRRKIPFFGIGKESWELNPNFWSSCFYTPSILNGREKYYWSLC